MCASTSIVNMSLRGASPGVKGWSGGVFVSPYSPDLFFLLMREGDPHRFFVCVQSVCIVHGYIFKTP
jgi:hypothetical protein